MPKFKAALFDADGVLIRQPEYFSRIYAREHGIDAQKLETFFDHEFMKASIGHADLKELIKKRYDLWQWGGDPQELLDSWFAAENCPDLELLQIIARQRQTGLKTYIASIQEKYRTNYFRNVMFPTGFDGIFTSSDFGYHKRDLEFFHKIIEFVTQDIPGVKPKNIVYFDDRQEGLNTAAELGIVTYLYEDPQQVARIMG